MFDSREAVTGIDLGASGVKLVRVRAGKGIRRLSNAGVAELAATDGGSWADKSAAALRQLLLDQGLKSRDLGRVVTAVSGPSLHLRQVEMPGLSEAELRSSLRYEARQHLPLENLGEAALDCQVLTSGSSEADGKQSVLMVGAPDTLVQSRVKVLNQLGIDPEVVDAAPLALLNALRGMDSEALSAGRTVVIADLGHSSTTLVFTRAGGVVYSRSVGPLAQAGAGNGTMAEDLTRAIQETSKFYAQMNERRLVEHVFLAGGGASSPDLAQVLQDRLKVPVALLDATRRLSYAPARDQKPSAADLATMAPRFAVALGLLFWGDDGV